MISRPSPVYDEVLIALSITPKSACKITREVSSVLGRPIAVSTVTRALKRAQIRGAACETVLGWAEPIDELSPNFPGADT